ncbi:MAG: maleate cis-trans isomerase [Nitrospinaceae bacterium]|nr:maleate cis-trans isomerase [Nitrospinaceae bacterium]
MDWKKKLGFIVPSWNTVMEYECQRMAPEGVSVHFTRVDHGIGAEKQVEEVPQLAELLGHANLDAICFGCTVASFVRPGIDQEISEIIEQKTNVPATTTTTAIIQALREMDVSRLALASPYRQELNDRLIQFLDGYGFEVTRERGLNIRGASFLPPEEVEALAREVDTPDADAILISCTNIRSLEVIDQLEADLGKPVLTSNAAALWYTLRVAGFEEPATAGGTLLRDHLSTVSHP